MAHSKLAPSAASRWSVCTASVQFIADHKAELPPSGGVYADEGTLAHELAAAKLNGKPLDKEILPEMATHVDRYVDFIWTNVRKGDLKYVERRVPLFYETADYGTVDAALVNDERVFIGDLKYGAGVSVEAEENKQLAIYAESLLREIHLIRDIPGEMMISMNIFQPRDRANANPVRNWTITRNQLREFIWSEITPAFDAIYKYPDRVKFVADPDNQCRFCPAKGLCKSHATYGLEALPVEIEVMGDAMALPDPNAITREQRIRVIAGRKALEKWLEAVEQQEVAELMNGAVAKGYKLVEGKSNRIWTDEEAAQKLLCNHLSMDQVRPPSDIVSPAAAEKLLAGITLSTKFENRFASLITKREGKPTLVPESDKRPALDLNPTKMLDNVDVI